MDQARKGFRRLHQDQGCFDRQSGDDQQPLLVAVEFGNATDNLFVIFDNRGRIISVDTYRDFV